MNASEHAGHPDWRDHAVPGALPMSAALSGPVEFSAEAARRLQSVSEKLGRFLQEQIKRLDSAARQCEDILTQRGSVEQMQQDLRREQTTWTEQQKQQQDEIRIEQDRLIQGWQTLEDEQRRLSVPNGATTSMAVAFSGPAAPSGNAMPGMAAAITPDRSVFAEQAYQQPSAAVAMSRESALEQFQKLKREIRNHTHRVQQGSRHNGNH